MLLPLEILDRSYHHLHHKKSELAQKSARLFEANPVNDLESCLEDALRRWHDRLAKGWPSEDRTRQALSLS